MTGGALTGWILSSLVLSLRIGPLFAFAPPFSLVPVPSLLRVFFAIAVAAAVVSAHPPLLLVSDRDIGTLASIAARELVIGLGFALTFQLLFAALYVAGRTIDIQAGYGLAMLIDPSTRTQTPLVGTLFAYAAGAVFVALNGHAELLRIFAASTEWLPIGAFHGVQSIAPLLAYMSTVFAIGLGAGGGVILCLFLADVAIAALSRTAPQLNVLILGFQAKSLILLAVLPTTFGLAGVLFARMIRLAFDALPRMV